MKFVSHCTPSARQAMPLALLCCASIGVLLVLHVGIGSVAIPPAAVLAALRDQGGDPAQRQIVWDLRLPRALIAVAAGALLGMAGALLQSVLRNPLAEPGLTGVSAGGVLAAVLWLATGKALARPSSSLPLVVLLGGIVAGLLVYLLSWRGRVDPLRLILTGVLISAVLQSAVSLLLLLSTEAIGGVLLWMIGSLSGRVWVHWAIIWPWALVALPLGWASAGLANSLQLGDEVAAGLGLPIELTRALLLCLAALLTAGAVAVVGGLGFIGLVGPHIARRLVGSDARRVFPLSALITAMLLLGADTLAQSLTFQISTGGTSSRVGLPVGALTALLGAPFFLYLVWRKTHI